MDYKSRIREQDAKNLEFIEAMIFWSVIGIYGIIIIAIALTLFNPARPDLTKVLTHLAIIGIMQCAMFPKVSKYISEKEIITVQGTVKFANRPHMITWLYLFLPLLALKEM